jgi:hypothetical protein
MRRLPCTNRRLGNESTRKKKTPQRAVAAAGSEFDFGFQVERLRARQACRRRRSSRAAAPTPSKPRLAGSGMPVTDNTPVLSAKL